MPNEAIKQQNIDKVLETAYECFLKHGIELVTMEMISRESGISRASLGRYFSGKRDLVFQTIRWIGKNYRTELAKKHVLTKVKSFNGLQKLSLFMEYGKMLYLEDSRPFILRSEFKIFVYRNSSDGSIEGEKLIEELEFRTILKKLFTEGTNDGSMLEGLDVENETSFFCEAFFGFLADSASGGKEDTEYLTEKLDRYIKRVSDSYRRV